MKKIIITQVITTIIFLSVFFIASYLTNSAMSIFAALAIAGVAISFASVAISPSSKIEDAALLSVIVGLTAMSAALACRYPVHDDTFILTVLILILLITILTAFGIKAIAEKLNINNERILFTSYLMQFSVIFFPMLNAEVDLILKTIIILITLAGIGWILFKYLNGDFSKKHEGR
ncbi:MAG: hypothetical protein Q7S33_02420 [Nanoarchaeota archaeon]|nr:hypothetical protein [Nanoarchaeota archaeon]